MTQLPYQAGIRDTVNALFARRLADAPHDVFIDMEGEQLTFAQFEDEVEAYARGLATMGVRKGDTVCALADNCMEMLILWFSTNRLGAIWVPLNSALKGEFLRHQIDDCEARVMMIAPAYLGRIMDIGDELHHLERLFVLDATTETTRTGSVETEPLANLRMADGPSLEAVSIEPHEPALIVYTSGTTGLSKGCLCSHNYICNYGRLMGWAIGLRNGDRLWFALPLFHLGGLGTGVMSGLNWGARLVIGRKFSVSGFWPEIERSGANVVAGVGAMLAFIIDAPDCEAAARCQGQIRTVCAAPLSTEQREKAMHRFGVKHIDQPGYGLTEVSMVTLFPIAEPSPPGVSGRRFADMSVRIVDENGEDLPTDAPGRILVKPNYPNVMFEEYWKNPEATAAAKFGDWFDTGDLGRIDEEGFLTFVDRGKDYLRRRGENISSFEVEGAFMQHPAIAEVAVHAVRSAVSEDDLKATIVLHPDAATSESEICLWSVARLPLYAVPRYIEFRAELPRNPVGRVLKYQLRDEGATPGTWDREQHPELIFREA